MSDSEMIEYEINDDLNVSLDKNTNEVQNKNNNDINLQFTKNSKNRFESNNLKPYGKNNKDINKFPINKIDSNINNILLGKTLKNNNPQNLISSINSKDKNNFSNTNNKGIINKNSIPIGNHINLNNPNSNLNSNTYNLIGKDSQFENLKLTNNSKNFNTISNLDSEGGFFSTKNKHSTNYKNFGNINNQNNSNNNNKNKSMNKKKSFEYDKTKTITNNKTDYKTLNSNNGNSRNGTLNSVGNSYSKYSKFEVRLLDHFNTLKNQKSAPINNTNNKETTLKKFNSNLNSKPKETHINMNNYLNNKVKNEIGKKENISNADNNNININTSNTGKNLKNSNIINNNISTINSQTINKKNSYLNLKLNLEPESNFNTNNNNNQSNSIDMRFPTTTKNDEKIKYLLSDQFKVSLDNSLRNNNKSFQSSVSKNNKYLAKKSLISFDLTKQKDNQRPVSIGERLYRKSVALKEMKEKRASIELFKKDMETINNCSFRPKICEDSIMLNIKSRYATISNSRNSIETNNDSRDFSTSYYVKRNSKLIESHKLKRELEDLKELRPSIKRSEKEINQLTDKLHQEKITLQVEREKLTDLYFSEIYPFKPTISNKEPANVDNFFDRLQNWVDKRNENYKNDILNSFYDKNTGHKLFKPTISKTIESPTHRHDMDLFSFLHEEKKIKFEKLKESEQINLKAIIEKSNLKLSNEKTDILNKLLKDDCYANLFSILDHNNDGVIECNEEFLKNAEEKLEKNILDLFNPIFAELKEHEESLSRDEFFLALDELFKVLNVQQRRLILNWYVELKRQDSISRKRVLVDTSNFTFHPHISENSQNYFSLSKRYSKNFLSRNDELLNSREVYKKEKSQEKMQKELEPCSFRPEVNKNSERIDKRNKSAFLLNLNNLDLEFLLRPKTTDKKRNISRI